MPPTIDDPSCATYYPLLFPRVTRDIQFVTDRRDERYRDVASRVYNAVIYRETERYRVWKVLSDERNTVDLLSTVIDDLVCDRIIDLILRYKIVYLTNAPHDRTRLIKHVGDRWKGKIVSDAGVR